MSSFGETLRRERELRGIELREVAEATKISVRFLQALEGDRLDVLPGGIFPRAFVRQYAAYLGLDPERMVAEFMYAVGGEEAAAPRPASPAPAPAGALARLPGGRATIVAAAAVGLILAVAAWHQLRSDEPRPTPVPTQAAVPVPPVPSSDRVFPPPTATPGATLSPGEKLVLDLTALQDCWVAVQADGVRVMDRVLVQGETLTLNAERELVLSVGNAGGISFRINGRPGVSLGRQGEVRRNIVITHESLPSLVESAAEAPRSG